MTVQPLSDRDAICELKARYCRFLDLKRWDDWADLFTEDFILDTSEAGGPPPIAGRAAAIAVVRATIDPAVTAHHVHNPEIAITGDTADGIWAMQDRVRFGDGSNIVGYGHYIERYVKQGGAWKIAQSKLTRLHIDYTPPPA